MALYYHVILCHVQLILGHRIKDKGFYTQVLFSTLIYQYKPKGSIMVESVNILKAEITIEIRSVRATEACGKVILKFKR